MPEQDPHKSAPDPNVWEKVSHGPSKVDPLHPFANQRIALGPAAGQLRDGEMVVGSEIYRRKEDHKPQK